MLSFMAAFWTFGNLIVAGMAWLIIPLSESFTNKFTIFYAKYEFFFYRHWFSYAILCVQFMANIFSDLFRSIVRCSCIISIPTGES